MSDQTETGVPQTLAGQREQILASATIAFATRGYHATSYEEICSESGVDSRALMTEFPQKYELFREIVMASVNRLVDAVAVPASVPVSARQARAELQSTIENVTKVYIESRAHGGFYRSESRYLRPEHQEEMLAVIRESRRRIRVPLMGLRPSLSTEDADLLVAAALSSIASVSVHPTTLPAQKMLTLLSLSAMRILESDPAVLAPSAKPAVGFTPGWQLDTSERGTIIAAAIELIFTRGFNAVTIEDIAASANVPRLLVHEQFGSTSDLIKQALLEGNVNFEAETDLAMNSSPVAREVLIELATSYVEHMFCDPMLLTVFLNDARYLPDETGTKMVHLQIVFVNKWIQVLSSVRPELSTAEVAFLVFAALSIVADTGRLVAWDNRPDTKAKIVKLVLNAMMLYR